MSNVKTENTIKRLEQDKQKASPEMKQEIQSKINALKNNREILK